MEHEHSYQPNGLVREAASTHSPYSTLDDQLYDKVYSIGLCGCGDIKKTHVANENVRYRGDDLRKERRSNK